MFGWLRFPVSGLPSITNTTMSFLIRSSFTVLFVLSCSTWLTIRSSAQGLSNLQPSSNLSIPLNDTIIDGENQLIVGPSLVYRTNTDRELLRVNSSREVVSPSMVLIKDRVCIGCTNPKLIPSSNTQRYMLSVNGSVEARELVINDRKNEWTKWPDYVFSPGYALPDLHTLDSLIHAEHHLPGMPSAAQVQDEGVNVGEVQRRSLEKIEELTLYMIELRKENDELRNRVEMLEARATANAR